MAKKALVSKIEPRGKDNSGYRVLDIVKVGDEFEVHSNFEWKDCSDNVVTNIYWYDPNTNTFKKLPEAVNASATAGEIAVDAEGNPTEEYEWNWDTETWSKVQVL
jgi:hypothetical protein